MTNTQEDTEEFLITVLEFLNELIYLCNKELNKNFQIITTEISSKLNLKDFRELENNVLN